MALSDLKRRRVLTPGTPQGGGVCGYLLKWEGLHPPWIMTDLLGQSGLQLRSLP